MKQTLIRILAASFFLPLAVAAFAAENFNACPQFFANSKSPVVTLRATDRALCYDAFAILHSGESKTPIFVAEKLNRGKRFGPLEAADVLAAIARIEAHTADVAKALAEAQGRWVIKDRELIDGNDR